MTDREYSKIFYAVSMAFQLGFIIVLSIGGFLFLGVLGDQFFGTRPLFLILGIINGTILTIYGVYHSVIPIIKDKNL